VEVCGLNGLKEGARASQAGGQGQSARRLCKPVAQSESDAQGGIQSGKFEKELRGRQTQLWEIIYSRLCQSQMPVVERAIERGRSWAQFYAVGLRKLSN
jgi:hypothetical protein